MRIFNILMEKRMSFSELLQETGFSRPVLTKHLKELQRDSTIYKDTIKRDETSDHEEVGKIVYALAPEDAIEMFAKQMVEMNSVIPYLDIDEGTKEKIQEHYDAIARIGLSTRRKRKPKPAS